MSIHVLKPGLCTSLQDCGRYGYQHLGLSPGGAMDELSHRMANILVGNVDDCASLEITLQGPTLRFDDYALIALCGADLQASLNQQALPLKRPWLVQPGDILSFGPCLSGMRAYLAIYGGLAVTPILGSQSTLLRSQLGGWQGRILQRGDTLPLAHKLSLSAPQARELEQQVWQERIYLPGALNPAPRQSIRLIPGEHLPWLTASSQRRLFEQSYRIASSSERMGYRLESAPLERDHQQELLSAATSFGTVQVPNDGQAIILMADRQTTGGYPKVGQVASVDLTQIAQRLPGTTLRFEAIAPEAAALLDQQREAALQRLQGSRGEFRALLAQYQQAKPDAYKNNL